MKFERVNLVDIQHAIDRIEQFSRDEDEAAFLKDEEGMSAIMRELAVIGEAVKGVGNRTRGRFREVSWDDWRLVRNTLVHEHYTVYPRTLWRTLQRDLPPLKRAVEALLAE
jgi:uncharacterized protein with HEPN domain